MKLQIKRLTKTAITPEYQTAGAACFDLHADGVEFPTTVWPNSNRIVDTGLAVKVPDGHALFVFSRSGHGFKNNVTLSNCVGVIDSDHVGEIKIALSNHGDDNFVFRQGDRIAQGLVLPVERVVFDEVDELPETVRWGWWIWIDRGRCMNWGIAWVLGCAVTSLLCYVIERCFTNR